MLYVVFLVETFLKKSYPEELAKSQTDGTVRLRIPLILRVLFLPKSSKEKNYITVPCELSSSKTNETTGTRTRTGNVHVHNAITCTGTVHKK
jgi:hypothetical protein